MKPVRCPTCDLRWNIRDDAPRVITCPRCLAALNNPYPAPADAFAARGFAEQQRVLPGSAKPQAAVNPESSAPTTPTNRPPPLPVAAIETQVHRDARVSAVGIVIVLAIVVFGVLSLFAAGVSGAQSSTFLLIALAVIVGTVVTVIVISLKKKSPVIAMAGIATSASYTPNAAVLNYQAATADPRKLSPGAFFGQFIAGVVLGVIAMCLLVGFFGGISRGELVIVGVLLEPVIGIALCFKPQLRGLGIGMVLAIPVAFLLLLGFCAIILSGGGLKF